MNYPHGNYYNDSYNRTNYYPHHYNNNRQRYNNYPNNKYNRGGYKKNNEYDNGYSNSRPPKFNPLPMSLEKAIEESSIPGDLSDLRVFIKDFLIKYHSKNKEVEIYLTPVGEEKIFVIEQNLSIPIMNNNYKITLLIYLPILFPNYEPEIYISKKTKGGLCIERSYEEKINPKELRINLDYFCPLERDCKNLEEIVNNIKKEFTNQFPIYKGSDYNYNDQNGKCFLNKKCSNKILFDSSIQQLNYNNDIEDKKDNNLNDNHFNKKKENFDDIDFMEFMRTQVKDILREKYLNFKEANHPDGNYDLLKKMDNKLKNKKDKNMGLNIEKLNEEKEKLNKIKNNLVSIEKKLKQENEQIKNIKKTVFDKCDEIIKIKNQKVFELIIMKKTLEDYLMYLKKGFEKKVFSFEDMVMKIRSFSREIFNINYSINNLKNEI